MSNWIPVIAAIVGGASGLLAALFAFKGNRDKYRDELAFQRSKFEEELKTQREKLAAEYATQKSVEAALLKILMLEKYRFRSFQMIRHQIGGFEANELRRLLVRTGAVRFMAADGTEMWCLVERAETEFRQGQAKLLESPTNKRPTENLFPQAFGDSSQY